MNEKKKVGRPELPEVEKMITRSIRLKPCQDEKFTLLGAGKWVRNKIDLAKVK